LINYCSESILKFVNRWTDSVLAVCTLESGAPNCRTYSSAIGSYVSDVATPELWMLCSAAGKLKFALKVR